MPSHNALLLLIAPLAFWAVHLTAQLDPGRAPRRVFLAARFAIVAALGTTVLGLVMLWQQGPQTSAVLGLAHYGLSVRLDALSLFMLTLVTSVGAAVLEYSRNYLDGDARHGRFMGRLGLTLASVSLLVTAGNLILLALAWVSTSLALHRLLLFYPQRPGARLAARKKFVTARIGDLAVIGAAVLLANSFGTGDLADLNQAAAAALDTGAPTPAIAAAFLLALAALLKCAQLPLHGWLTEVMETPTPVSALLHAGIINAGGFLVLRLADVMLLSWGALDMLVLVGGASAVIAALVMLTQTSVKVSLAWSTIAQMGFMLVQCGLGAFHLAALHLFAHGYYKAHAFLTSGSVVDQARVQRFAPPAGALQAPLACAGIALTLVIHFGTAQLFGLHLADDGPLMVLGVVYLLGLAPIALRLLSGPDGLRGLGWSLALVTLVSVAYFGLHRLGLLMFAGALPDATGTAPDLWPVLLVLAAFIAAGTLHLRVADRGATPRAEWLEALHVHLAGGLYLNTWFDRLVGPGAGPDATTDPQRI